MKIKNNGKEFAIKYGAVDYKIPEGEMEISDDAMGVFILAKARFWGLDVIKTSNSTKAKVEPIEVIKAGTEEVKEEVKEEEVKEEKPKRGKKADK